MLLLNYLSRLALAARLLVLGAHADTLDTDKPQLGVHVGNLPRFAFVVAGEDDYRIAFFNMQSVHMILSKSCRVTVL